MKNAKLFLPTGKLCGLRALAAGRTRAVAAAPAGGAPQHVPRSAAGAAATVPDAAARTALSRRIVQAQSRAAPNEDDKRLVETVRRLLEGRKPAVAALLVEQAWVLSRRCLADKDLSKELIVQLISSEGTAAALQMLPMLTSSCRMCSAAIKALKERRNLKGVRAVLQHARDTGVAAGVDGRGVWRAAIVAFGALRRPQEARQAFVSMRAAAAWTVEDTETVNLLLNALAHSIELQFIRCKQLLNEGVVPDTSTFNCLLKACMLARDTRRAELALQWMAEAGVPANEVTFNTLIKVFSYSKDFERVLSVWRQMSATGFAPTARLWGSLLLACSAAGQLEQAGIVWWEMRQLHSQGLGDVLTTDNVCGMMTACNDAGQYERSLAAFEEARSLGVPMDTRAFNIALRACHTPGKTPRQEQLLHAFALYDELKRSGLRPDTYTFATLFSLCAAAHQGHCALQLHNEMLELRVQENVVALTALIKAVGGTPGMAEECHRLFRRMATGPARLKPNQATYRTMVGALREQGELAAALRVYESMRRLYPADNNEFEWLLAVAAERALRAEDADLRAAVAAVCGITTSRKVDLHGMSVLEARAAVLCILALLQQQYRDRGTITHDAIIITGQGLGSAGGEPVVRQEVIRLLEALLVQLPPEALSANAGRIVIPQQLLCEAMQRKMQSKVKVPPARSPLPPNPLGQQQQERQVEGG
ncbi:hypothetical protein D9Q98_000443 [Chlorella vulgaris]|uniref:Smr domain-containing protein n=1 Tax=Chlorella vulgaris TaxID=3077 RepID=A0A9D4TYE6_CHLVU|nr:hypothetical protein D9Q98_000443 [Chlorella vulgaris]